MELKMISMKDIVTNPLQPRQEFKREALQELANSIKEAELLQPIVVRNFKGKFEIVAGERRFKAFQILKEPKIPAIVRDIEDDTDALEKSLIENWHRVNLNTVEGENALNELWKSGKYKSIRELSRKTGISDGNLVNILKATEERETLGIKHSNNITYDDLSRTRILKDSPEVRKKLLEKRAKHEIKSQSELYNISSKLAEFPEPEQQLEILEEFEQQEDMSREMFDDIVRKKKEIVDGKREPEYNIEIEPDSNKRRLERYYDAKSRMLIYDAEHIQHMPLHLRKEAIQIIKDIIHFMNVQRNKLDEVIDEGD